MRRWPKGAPSRWVAGRNSIRRRPAKIIGEFEESGDPAHRYSLVSQLCEGYRTANDKKLRGVKEDFVKFAEERLPKTLTRQNNYYDNTVSLVADSLHQVSGPRAGLAFVIGRLENEPAWAPIQLSKRLEPAVEPPGSLAS